MTAIVAAVVADRAIILVDSQAAINATNGAQLAGAVMNKVHSVPHAAYALAIRGEHSAVVGIAGALSFFADLDGLAAKIAELMRGFAAAIAGVSALQIVVGGWSDSAQAPRLLYAVSPDFSPVFVPAVIAPALSPEQLRAAGVAMDDGGNVQFSDDPGADLLRIMEAQRTLWPGQIGGAVVETVVTKDEIRQRVRRRWGRRPCSES